MAKGVREVHMGGKIKASLAIAMAFCLVLVASVPCHAWDSAAETRYELISGGVTFGNDLIITGQKEAMFHQQVLAAADDEGLGISFPGALPFSPSQNVDISLPSISQTVSQSMVVSNVGFFAANLPFYPCCNYGAAPVGVGHFGEPSPVRPASFKGNALMYPEMINEDILDPNLTYDTKNTNNTMVSLPPAMASGAYGEVASVANSTAGESLRNNTTPGNATIANTTIASNQTRGDKAVASNNSTAGGKPMNNSATVNVAPPILLSELRYDFDADADHINNSSIVERMWRNSHLGHLANIAYEGDASGPVWMEPLRPTDALQRTNHTRVLNYALNQTKPGADIVKAFWDL